MCRAPGRQSLVSMLHRHGAHPPLLSSGGCRLSKEVVLNNLFHCNLLSTYSLLRHPGEHQALTPRRCCSPAMAPEHQKLNSKALWPLGSWDQQDSRMTHVEEFPPVKGGETEARPVPRLGSIPHCSCLECSHGELSYALLLCLPSLGVRGRMTGERGGHRGSLQAQRGEGTA